MAWIKAFHIIFMVTWFAGLFYLPRLYVYHAMATDTASLQRFTVMERKLFWGIMTPGATITVVLGSLMLVASPYYLDENWMRLKLTAVAAMVLYHIWCGKLLSDFKDNRNVRDHIWYRWFNEVPVIFLVVIVVLTVVRPL
jgi:putative membrane protein